MAAFFITASSIQAQVPAQIPFQGLLLDSGGTPVNDAVDLDFELFDAIASGASLWTESHLGVIVVDGVYSVNLGSQTPLTQSILSGGTVFLEISVSGETLVPRQQLLSVPFARVAESVGSTSALLLEQMVQHFSFDGQVPSNDDPEE